MNSDYSTEAAASTFVTVGARGTWPQCTLWWTWFESFESLSLKGQKHLLDLATSMVFHMSSILLYSKWDKNWSAEGEGTHRNRKPTGSTSFKIRYPKQRFEHVWNILHSLESRTLPPCRGFTLDLGATASLRLRNEQRSLEVPQPQNNSAIWGV